MICLEEDGVVSHYCWIDDNTLLTTWVKGGYYIYDIARGKKTHLDVSQLANDGHPSCLDHNQFISDTYPLKQSLQHLFMSSIDGTNYQEIAEMVSDPRQYDEKRCDLHPRLSASKRYVTCDSTFKDGKRSILLFDIGGLN